MLTSTGCLIVSQKAKFPLSEEEKINTSDTFLRIVKLIYCGIADHCDNQHTCFPSFAKLAEHAFCSKRSVRRAINWLEAHGYILIVSKGYPGRSTIYQWLNPEDIKLNNGLKPTPEIPSKPGLKVIRNTAKPEMTRDRSLEYDLTDTSWAD